jgi:hypothetical protein
LAASYSATGGLDSIAVHIVSAAVVYLRNRVLKNLRPRITRKQKIVWRVEHLAKGDATPMARDLSSTPSGSQNYSLEYPTVFISKKPTALKKNKDSAANLPDTMKFMVQEGKEIFCKLLSEDDKHYHILTSYTGSSTELFAWKADWLKSADAAS